MYQYKARVNRIIDGDSVVLDIDLGFDIWMDNQHVRIYGIDTPEIRTKDLDEKKIGFIAKKHVEDLLPIGEIIKVNTYMNKSSKFGRILAKIINIDGVDVGLSLLENHLAVEYYGQSKDEIKQAHLDNRMILILEGKFNPNESTQI